MRRLKMLTRDGYYSTVRSYLSSDLELTTLDRIKDEAEEEAIRRLLIRKQNLLAELEHVNTSTSLTVAEVTGQVQLGLTHDHENVVLLIQLDGGGLIQAAIIFAEGLFPKGESHAVHLSTPSSSTRIPLPVQRHLAVDLHVNVLVVSPSNEVLKVIEIVHPLPTFSRFKPVEWTVRKSLVSNSRFRIRTRLQERIQRVVIECSIFTPDWTNSKP